MIRKGKSSYRFYMSLERLDVNLLATIYLIISISTIFVYSATKTKTNTFIYKQIVWIIFGTIIMILVTFMDYRVYKKYLIHFYLLGIGLLLYVLVNGVSKLGARRWIDIGIMDMQPSELVKIILIICLAGYISRFFSGGFNTFTSIILGGLPIIPPFLLIAIQPDLGTALVLIFLYFIIVFLCGARIKYLVILVLLGILFSIFSYFFLFRDYQKERVDTLIRPAVHKIENSYNSILVKLNLKTEEEAKKEKIKENNSLGSDWNSTQSKISIGSGKLFGKGLFNGNQSRLRFLPESHTDFIFAVLAEETGFLGSTMIILLYFLLILNIIKISRKTDDLFGKIILFGISGIFFVHTVVNIGMTIGIMPVTGLPLLFMSYGGSSFLLTFAIIGLVESIRIHID